MWICMAGGKDLIKGTNQQWYLALLIVISLSESSWEHMSL